MILKSGTTKAIELDKDLELIKKAVNEKLLPKYKCSICNMSGSENIEIVSGYLINSVQSNLHTLSFGGNTIPTLGMICKNCGIIHQFYI